MMLFKKLLGLNSPSITVDILAFYLSKSSRVLQCKKDIIETTERTMYEEIKPFYISVCIDNMLRDVLKELIDKDIIEIKE